jgi:hypothetical protein
VASGTLLRQGDASWSGFVGADSSDLRLLPVGVRLSIMDVPVPAGLSDGGTARSRPGGRAVRFA